MWQQITNRRVSGTVKCRSMRRRSPQVLTQILPVVGYFLMSVPRAQLVTKSNALNNCLKLSFQRARPWRTVPMDGPSCCLLQYGCRPAAPRSSSCPASATLEGHQHSSLIGAKYPVTKHCGRKLNTVMIHGFCSSVRSHAANVLLGDRKGPQSMSAIILLPPKRCCTSKFCGAGLGITSDVGRLLSGGSKLESGGQWSLAELRSKQQRGQTSAAPAAAPACS